MEPDMANVAGRLVFTLVFLFFCTACGFGSDPEPQDGSCRYHKAVGRYRWYDARHKVWRNVNYRIEIHDLARYENPVGIAIMGNKPMEISDVTDEYFGAVQILEAHRADDGNYCVRILELGKDLPFRTMWSGGLYREAKMRKLSDLRT